VKNIESSPKAITLESFGGTGGLVTGSCHSLENDNSKILIDCGLFQGFHEERSERGERRNFEPISKIVKGATQVLATHTHIDHTGRIPLIFKNGFTPEILATEGTAAFMEPLLYNSAQIQESENPQNELYQAYDVDKTLRYLSSVEPFTPISIGQKNSGLTAEFLLNGHVMGSASIIVRGPNGQKSILFTGDIGKPDQSLCGGYNDFADKYPQYPINTIIVESTNFEKPSISLEDRQDSLIEAINEAWANGGNPVLPCLSFHRSQEIMEIIHHGQETGKIPSDCYVYIDAPLAIEILKTIIELGPEHLSKRYGNDPNYYDSDENSMKRFLLKNTTVIGSHESSMANDRALAMCRGKVIILASGGMGGHGRSVNYLKGNFCKNPQNTVILTCHQVTGTQGAQLLEKQSVSSGKRQGAKVLKVEGFTSHASGEETFRFLERFNLSQLDNIVITHGRDSSRKAMAQEFKRRGFPATVILSDIHQKISL
jgi:metallo-beta-lactamase family protein